MQRDGIFLARQYIKANFEPKKKHSMKRKRKIACITAILIPISVAAIFCLHWAWKYYGLTEWPDRKEYKTIEERAERALAFAKRHHMNERYALFVNYRIPSGTPRLFVWDFQQKRIIARTYVMHGPGGGSTDKRPRFSNRPGSGCSSLGRFLVTKEHGNVNRRGFRIKGLDPDNRTAYARGLMIHGSGWVDSHCWMRYIPLRAKSSLGCVTVSSRGMDYLYSLITKEREPLLLWNYY